jgi:hypothetical protein
MVPGSSAAARLVRGVDALTRRDFAFPERRTAVLTVALADGGRRAVELPWWVSPGARRHTVAGGWARRTGLPTTDRLPWFEDAWRPRPGATAEGAPPWAPAVPPTAVPALLQWTDENGRVAVRAGDVERGVAHPFCYLQILTFHTEQLVGPGGDRPFREPIEDFVRGCSERGRDLVLDLRRNEGGYLDHTSAVAAALLPPGAKVARAALLVGANARNEAVYRERSGSSAGTGPLAPRRVLAEIEAARRGGHALTPAFLTAPLRPAGGGFAGRVVALTSPACMSACDRLAALLAAFGRAVLVGGPTEGAGGSQQETDGLPARWTDSSRALSVAIPNAAFGVARGAAGAVVTAGNRSPLAALSPSGGEGKGRGGDGQASVDADQVPVEDFFRSYGIENHPVEPGVRFEPGAEDVSGAGRGWIEQVEAILNHTPLT